MNEQDITKELLERLVFEEKMTDKKNCRLLQCFKFKNYRTKKKI